MDRLILSGLEKHRQLRRARFGGSLAGPIGYSCGSPLLPLSVPGFLSESRGIEWGQPSPTHSGSACIWWLKWDETFPNIKVFLLSRGFLLLRPLPQG